MELHPDIIAAIVTGIGSVFAIIVGSIKMLANRLDKMLKELRPNGGSSIKDKVDKLEHRIDELYHYIIREGK